MNEYYEIFAWSDCPYCIKAKELLIKHNKQFMLCILDESKDLLDHIKEKYNWMTVPMIVRYERCYPLQWQQEFIGGYSDLVKKFGDDNETSNSES
jgi:glutaredoxin